jgi:NDP-sugar pyrophosphorylase family protein
MKAVILAGGKGTRLAPYTTILPKPLMPIGDMPILEILLRQMKRAGIQEVIITIGHLAHLLQAFFQGGERLGLKIQYSLEDHPLGTAGPISLIRGLEKTFLVANGDILTTLNLADLVRTHQESGAAATIATHFRQVKIDLGVIQSNNSNEVCGYIEKPSYDFSVSMGIYVFEPRVLEYIPHNQYLDFPDLVLRLIENKEKVMSYPFKGYWQDLGRADDYEQAVQDFEEMRKHILPESDNTWK